MLDAAAIRAELELELEWREAEVRFMENRASGLDEQATARFRRALILLVYAHLEGFCRVAFATYATHINNAGYRVRETDWAIAAAALDAVFRRLRDNDLKNDVFKRALPNDAKLHRFCRERDFLEQLHEFEGQAVQIDVDAVVDVESNLKPVVLRKLLYRLGLDPTLADQWTGDLNQLLNWRNNIAHGATRRPVEQRDYEKLRSAATSICTGVMLLIFDAAHSGGHLRTVAAPPTPPPPP